MRFALTSAIALVLLAAAPAAHADQAIVAGPNSTYLTTSVSMDQGEPLTFYSFDAPNHDVVSHTKGADGKPLFGTPLIGAGESAFVEGSQFLTAGTYHFFCSIHANMQGNLTVTSAGTPGRPARPGRRQRLEEAGREGQAEERRRSRGAQQRQAPGGGVG